MNNYYFIFYCPKRDEFVSLDKTTMRTIYFNNINNICENEFFKTFEEVEMLVMLQPELIRFNLIAVEKKLNLTVNFTFTYEPNFVKKLICYEYKLYSEVEKMFPEFDIRKKSYPN